MILRRWTFSRIRVRRVPYEYSVRFQDGFVSRELQNQLNGMRYTCSSERSPSIHIPNEYLEGNSNRVGPPPPLFFQGSLIFLGSLTSWRGDVHFREVCQEVENGHLSNGISPFPERMFFLGSLRSWRQEVRIRLLGLQR